MAEQSFILPQGPNGHGLAATRIAAVVKGLSASHAWRISIAQHKPKRSDQQNRYLWGVCYKTILDSGHLQGWDSEDLHEYLLGEHFGWEVIEGFGKRRLKPLRRSSALNKMEFRDYVDFIQRKMADLGIFIPDAEAA